MADTKKVNNEEAKAAKKASAAPKKATVATKKATVATVKATVATKKATAAAKKAAVLDKAAANEIEIKKAVRNTGRKVKEAAEKGKVKKEDVKETIMAHEIAGKERSAKAKRAVKETAAKVKKSVAAPAKKQAAAKLKIVIQSPMGGAITAEEISARMPKGVDSVFVRVDENKLYYVLKNGETGNVDIW